MVHCTHGTEGSCYEVFQFPGFSGVAGPLVAQGGGQICRHFYLRFWKLESCLKHKSHVLHPR